MVEQHPFKVMVGGSNPPGLTKKFLTEFFSASTLRKREYVYNAEWCNGNTPVFGTGNSWFDPKLRSTSTSSVLATGFDEVWTRMRSLP